ncbi:MAG: hypothetical protein JSR48_10135 [Verrucomicrobia bacterium]|nr:hypothetical protein [Verrucomicrobiota bacterium]
MISPLRLCLLLVLVTVTSYYVVLHARLLPIGHPVTQDEPCFVEITAGGNPFTHEGVLACASVYGPGYALWARPFTALIANPYVAHRVASSAALLALLALLGWELHRAKVGGLTTAAGLAIVYILNVSSHSLSACGDLLGAALYLASLAASRRNTWTGLFAGLVLAVLATLTKPYFALAWGIAVTHQLLFSPPRRSVAYLGMSAVVITATVLLLRWFAPYYFVSTVFTQTVAGERSLGTLTHQTAEFALLAGGLIVLAMMARPRPRRVAVEWGKAPLAPAMDFWAWSALIATAALLGLLAWHPGNYLVYFYHLLLGPLVLIALPRLAKWPLAGRGLLIANLLILGWQLPPQPGPDNWPTLAASVNAVQGRVLGDAMLEPFARSRPGTELLAHGQTASVLQALDRLGPAIPSRYAGLRRELEERAATLAERIRRHEFAAIYITYIDLGDRSVWAYELAPIRLALFSSYRVASEVPVFPYNAPYWDRRGHGQLAYRVTQWVPAQQE